jgi:N-acetylglutamate synthase-like GNAT family acetyltransferase
MRQSPKAAGDRVFEIGRDGVYVSTDSAKLDLDVIHGYLVQSYWSKGIPRETVAHAIQHSLCFGAYDSNGPQVGFARVITDFATFAYIADVFVLESHRGRGISKLIMECIKQHPELQGLRRWTLSTKDAHTLYAQFGFTPLNSPGNFMEILRPNIYESL